MEVTNQIAKTSSKSSVRKKKEPFFSSSNAMATQQPFFQPKFTVNTPGDIYEQEADAVADKVMSAPAMENKPIGIEPISGISAKALTGNANVTSHAENNSISNFFEQEEEIQMKPDVENSKEKDINKIGQNACGMETSVSEPTENKIISRKVTSHGGGNDSLHSVEQALSASGEGMDGETQIFMENRFGYDFSDVKIHDDSLGHQSSSEINARAYTHKNQIVFGEGQYKPDTADGKKLLAHELTHVVQQRASGAPSVQRFLDTLIPLTVTATGFRQAALELSDNIEDPDVKANARIMVVIGRRMHVYDGSGVQLTTTRAVRLTSRIPLGNGIYKSVRTGDGTLFFFRLFREPEGNVTAVRAVHNIEDTGAEDMMLNDVVRDRDQDYLTEQLGEITHWFLIIPGEAGGSGGSASTPGWATSQAAGATRRLRGSGGGESAGSGTETGEEIPPREVPDRVVPYANERGVFANVWAGGTHRAIRLTEGEDPATTDARIRQTTAELRDSRDPTLSTAVSEGATETGFTEPGEGDRPQSEMEGSGPVVDPEQERLRLGTSEGRANWPPYPARINNYGTDISVTGGNNRMAMEINYSIAGSSTLSQVAARLQFINYYWEIFDVTDVSVEAERDAIARQGTGPDYVGAGSGVGNELSRDMHNIYEDQMADLAVMGEAGAANIAMWEYRKAQLALMAISSAVRTVGSLVSSFISIVSTPINERNIGWDREGEFIVRCVATPSYDEDSPNRRASSVAVQPIKIMNINNRAEEALSSPETELENLRERLAAATTEGEREQLLEAITRAERIGAQTTMESVAEQVTEANQRLQAVDEIIAQMEAGTDPTAMSIRARLLRVQLLLNGVQPSEYREHVNGQLEQMRNMQRYGQQMSRGLRPPLYRPRVVLASEETGQVFQMVTMLGETTASREGSRVYRLVDLTSPNTQDYYEGSSSAAGIQGHSEAIYNSFIRFRENNGYGRGTIAIRLPANIPDGVAQPGQMRSAPGERGRWIQRLQDLATVAEVAGLVVTGPAGIAIGIASGLAGAAIAVDSLMRRSHAGRFSWNFQTFMEVTAVIGGAIPFFGLSRRFERTVYFIGVAQLGQSALAIPIQLEEQLTAIRMQLDLPEGERRARMAEAFLQAVRSGAVLIVSARQMAQHGPPAPHDSTSTPRGATEVSADASSSPVHETVEPADSTRPTDPDMMRPAAETIPGDMEPADSTRETLIDIDVPRERGSETEGSPDSEPVMLEPGVEEAVRRGRDGDADSDLSTRQASGEEPITGRETEPDTLEPTREESEADSPTRTRPTARSSEPMISAAELLRAKIAELLGGITLSAHGSDRVRTRQRALQVEALVRDNHVLAALAESTIIEIGRFSRLREMMGNAHFGDTPEANLMAQQVLQEVRMQLGDSAIREGLEFAHQLYPDVTPRMVDQGTPGFASDRDVTLQFRGGGEANGSQRIDASLQAVARAYESLRRRGIEPDAMLDTNFYTELHEASIRPESPREAAQIVFDQSIVALAEMHMGMTATEWAAYRESQLARLRGDVPSDSTQGRMEAEARQRIETEMAAAEALSARLRPADSTASSRDAMLAEKREALAEALRRNAPPREIRQLMAEIKLLEPEAYGTRAAVESVVGRQQTVARGDADTYMTRRSLPEGRMERLAFLSQDASAQLGLLFGHSRGSTVGTARSVAKYLQRIVHAVVVDGRLPAGASREFVANLLAIIRTKSMTPASAADAAAIQLIRDGLASAGRSSESFAAMDDVALVNAWVELARGHGVELVGAMRAAEQMIHTEPGAINPLEP